MMEANVCGMADICSAISLLHDDDADAVPTNTTETKARAKAAYLQHPDCDKLRTRPQVKRPTRRQTDWQVLASTSTQAGAFGAATVAAVAAAWPNKYINLGIRARLSRTIWSFAGAYGYPGKAGGNVHVDVNNGRALRSTNPSEKLCNTGGDVFLFFFCEVCIRTLDNRTRMPMAG